MQSQYGPPCVLTDGLMKVDRLHESRFNDLAATGPESRFTEDQVDNILDTVRANAQPAEGVA